MKTISFVISHKENERRRALIPGDIQSIEHRGQVFVETGYGVDLGYSDSEYEAAGVSVCSR